MQTLGVVAVAIYDLWLVVMVIINLQPQRAQRYGLRQPWYALLIFGLLGIALNLLLVKS